MPGMALFYFRINMSIRHPAQPFVRLATRAATLASFATGSTELI